MTIDFKPAFSSLGWLFSILIPSVMIGIPVLLLSLEENVPLALLLTVIIPTGIFSIISLFFLTIYPTMKYTLDEQHLVLRCGPFRSVIPYNEIKEIVKTNLRYHPTSSGWKLPCYALFKIYYADRGWVRMCATRTLRDVMLIITDRQLYGITPANEVEFLAALRERMR
jgi:hypothetical protein